jgi:archaetidylinositol phosphate synthase
MSGATWSHVIARPLVRPMIGTRIRPNHITTLRLLTGVAACACLALGTRAGTWWGGGLWIVSAFLDNADGELARLGNLSSQWGHLYDTYSDILVNTLLFMAMGANLRHGELGAWAVPLGLLAGISLLLASVFVHLIERRSPPGTKAYSGRWGFAPEDALYLMAPLAWLGWLFPILIGTDLVAPAIMLLTAWRLYRMPVS